MEIVSATAAVHDVDETFRTKWSHETVLVSTAPVWGSFPAASSPTSVRATPNEGAAAPSDDVDDRGRVRTR